MKTPWDSPEMLLYSSHIPMADPGERPGGAAPPPPPPRPYFKRKLRLLILRPKAGCKTIDEINDIQHKARCQVVLL